MAKFKIGDKVEMVQRDGYYADFKNPGIVEWVDADGFVNASDAAGRSFTGAIESRFTAYEPRPSFKVGERVEVVKDASLSVAPGTQGVVLHQKNDYRTLVQFVGRDDLHDGQGRSMSDDCWWFPPANLAATPAVEKSDKHWVIAKLGVTGVPMPAPRPFIHTSESDAVLEAQRLAKACPGVKFVMYAARYEAFVEPPKPVEPDLRLRWL